MILHLVLDEKVIPRMMDSFDEYQPDANIYLCVTRKKKNDDLKYLYNRKNLNFLYGDSLKSIPWRKINTVCIHYLDLYKIIAFTYLSIAKCLRPKNVIFFAWGADYYDIAAKRGFKIYSDNNTYNNYSKKNNKNLLSSTLISCQRIVKSIFIKYRVNYIVASKLEYELILRATSPKKLKGRLEFSYYPLEEVLKKLINSNVHGNNIIIGNSASPSNNHEYVFDYIKNLPNAGENIYLPMNYGDFPNYKEDVKNLYDSCANIHILTEFMDLDSYNELLCECNTFIYGHFRQEGWGNIIIALYLGGKVYLPKNSQNYKNFKDFGFMVFILENINQTYAQQMTQKEKDRNRNLAVKLFSKESNKKHIKSICDALQ